MKPPQVGDERNLSAPPAALSCSFPSDGFGEGSAATTHPLNQILGAPFFPPAGMFRLAEQAADVGVPEIAGRAKHATLHINARPTVGLPMLTTCLSSGA